MSKTSRTTEGKRRKKRIWIVVAAAAVLLTQRGALLHIDVWGETAETTEATGSLNPAQEVILADGIEAALEELPAYAGEPSVEIHDNEPELSEEMDEGYEYYSELDSLGRCGYTEALVGEETMPTEKRGKIGMIRPTGWHTVKYDCVEDLYLYNRCHLLGYQLTGENANEKNLITGTRYMNTEGMLPYENEVASYVRETGHHVRYRVTPVFEGENLLASGVVMEAESCEDTEISFCVYCYNVQPGVNIDYSDGDSQSEEEE